MSKAFLLCSTERGMCGRRRRRRMLIVLCFFAVAAAHSYVAYLQSKKLPGWAIFLGDVDGSKKLTIYRDAKKSYNSLCEWHTREQNIGFKQHTQDKHTVCVSSLLVSLLFNRILIAYYKRCKDIMNSEILYDRLSWRRWSFYTLCSLAPEPSIATDIHGIAVRNGLSPSIIQRRKNYDSNNVQPFTAAVVAFA